jgi:DNA-directed RNA polymerase specialized sigma24 family protein
MAQQTIFGCATADREQAFISLYKKAFPAAARYVSKKGGTFEDAKDIFQDALVIFYEKSIQGSVMLQTNEHAYLLGIAKHLWVKRFRESILNSSLDADWDMMEEDDLQPDQNKLMHYLETAGQKCMELLKAFYYDNLPVKSIAGLFGYSGERSATVQKYKCMEKVRETIKEKHLAYEDFIE